MIDLLVACIAFLMVTAVWAKTGAVEAHHRPQGRSDGPIVEPLDDDQVLSVHILRGGDVSVGRTAADELRVSARRDPSSLSRVFQQRRLAEPRTAVMQISADATTSFADIVQVMDVANGVWNVPGSHSPLAIHFR